MVKTGTATNNILLALSKLKQVKKNAENDAANSERNELTSPSSEDNSQPKSKPAWMLKKNNAMLKVMSMASLGTNKPKSTLASEKTQKALLQTRLALRKVSTEKPPLKSPRESTNTTDVRDEDENETIKERLL